MKVKDVTRGWGANPTAGQMRNLLALLWIKMVVGVLVLHVGFVMVGMLKHGGASSTPYNTLTVIRIGTTAVGVVGVFFGLMLRAPNPRCCPPRTLRGDLYSSCAQESVWQTRASTKRQSSLPATHLETLVKRKEADPFGTASLRLLFYFQIKKARDLSAGPSPELVLFDCHSANLPFMSFHHASSARGHTPATK